MLEVSKEKTSSLCKCQSDVERLKFNLMTVLRFMEKMNKRNRSESDRPHTTPAQMYNRKFLPYFEERRPLTQRERRELLMDNLLRGLNKQEEKEKKVVVKRGMRVHY